jgi:hypothetical protein
VSDEHTAARERRNAGITWSSGGAAATSASLMPVSAATRSGIALPGLTSDENWPSR